MADKASTVATNLRMQLAALVLTAAASLLAAGEARAGSFDCSRPFTPLEKLVCATPALVALDVEMTKKYDEAAAKLSPEGQKLLHDGQDTWLEFVEAVCVTYPEEGKTGEKCLAEQYRKRDFGVKAIGSRLFQSVDHFAIKRWEDEARYRKTGIVETHYPRIDAPATDAERKWNYLFQESYGVFEQYDNFESKYAITYVSDRLVSVKQNEYYQNYINPRSFGGGRSRNWLLAPEFREISPSDLFKDEKGAASFMARRIQKTLDRIDCAKFDKADLGAAALNPEKMTITASGMEVGFNPYDIAPYSCGPIVEKFTWKELAPYLSPTTPIKR